MAHPDDRLREGATDEVGSEGGSPGEIDVDRTAEILTGSEGGELAHPKREHVEKHDHQLERDGRPSPRP